MPTSEFNNSDDLFALLPKDIAGWRAKKPDGVYTSETLFDLIDGGAEVYRALKVRLVVSRRYEKERAPEIIADIFDMGSPADAFGAYRHDMREGKNPGIGKESEFLDSSLSFWKDRYFVSLIALDETKEAAQTLLQLAKTVADAVPEEGDFPDITKLLPREGTAFERAHYFHDKSLLDRHYFIADENLLYLDEETEGLLVRCRPGSPSENENKPTPAVLLLIRYPSREKAQKAYHRFVTQYLTGADEDGMARKATDRWAGARRKGDILVMIFDAASRAYGHKQIDQVMKQIAFESERDASHEEKE